MRVLLACECSGAVRDAMLAKGHENNVPAKLVDPVRRAQKAVSDALLPAPSAA